MDSIFASDLSEELQTQIYTDALDVHDFWNTFSEQYKQYSKNHSYYSAFRQKLVEKFSTPTPQDPGFGMPFEDKMDPFHSPAHASPHGRAQEGSSRPDPGEKHLLASLQTKEREDRLQEEARKQQQLEEQKRAEEQRRAQAEQQRLERERDIREQRLRDEEEARRQQALQEQRRREEQGGHADQ